MRNNHVLPNAGRTRQCMVGAAFFLLGLAAYSNTIGSFFVCDDFWLINSVSTGGPFGIWSQFSQVLFRPLISLSMYSDHRLWGLQPNGYHLTNIAFHCLNAFLVYVVAQLFLESMPGLEGRPRHLALVPGLIFLLSPSHTEAVSWISGRTDVIATSFALLSLLTYLMWRRSARLGYLLLAALTTLCAFLSKESAATLPLIILLWECYMRAAGQKRVPGTQFGPGLCAYLALCLLYAIAKALTTRAVVGRLVTTDYVRQVLGSLPRYLAAYASRALVPPTPIRGATVGFLAVLAIALCAGALRRTRLDRDDSALRFVACFLLPAFLLSVLPPLAGHLAVSTTTLMGDRVLYWPSVFASLAVSIMLWLAAPSRRVLAASLGCVLLLYAVTLWRLNENWRMAGHVSRNLVADIGQLRGDSLLVVNAPSDVRGAYVFWTFLDQAVELFAGGTTSARVPVLSAHSILSADDVVEVVRKDDAYLVHLMTPGDVFRFADSGLAAGRIEIRNSTPTRLQLRVLSLGPRDRLLYYSAGHFHALP